MDKTTVSKKTREYLNQAEREGRVRYVSYDLPKSFILCREGESIVVYISRLSSETVRGRIDSFLQCLVKHIFNKNPNMKGSYAMAKKNKRLAKCPYCGRSVSYLDSFFMKNKGEYTCKRCGCIANVGLNRNIYAITSILCVFVLLLVVLYMFF